MKTSTFLGLLVSTMVLIPAFMTSATETGTGSTTGTGTTSTGTTETGSTNTGSTSTGSTNTGSTSTGSTSTGSTSTGSTNTGSTNTGSTNTGSTNTGSTNTGSTSTGSVGTGVYCGSGKALALNTAQQAYLTELVRILEEKRVAYTAAMSLSGAAQVEAIKSANTKFRLAHRTAIMTLSIARKNIRMGTLVCRAQLIEDRIGKTERDRDDDDNRRNTQKQMKKLEKTVKKLEQDFRKSMKKGGRR